MSLAKIIIGLIFLTVTVLILIYVVPYFLQDKAGSQNDTASNDPLGVLAETNDHYAKALEQIKTGDYAEALLSLEASKKLASTPAENANIDFAVADVLLNFSRSESIDAYSALALNPAYPERTRALALLRAYLMYKKFNQLSMLQQIAENHSITWTVPEQVTYEIMRQVVDLYAFPYAQVKMLEFELLSVTDNIVAQQLFRQQDPIILAAIEAQKPYPGESTELTSAMLAYANVLSRLYFDFEGIDTSRVSDTYEDLIDYDNVRNFTVNKQYALLAYANFLAGDTQIEKANEVLALLLTEALAPALQESLPKTDPQVVYPNLNLLLETADTPVRSLITSIGSTRN